MNIIEYHQLDNSEDKKYFLKKRVKGLKCIMSNLDSCIGESNDLDSFIHFLSDALGDIEYMLDDL